ncbi:MAG: pyridine nucleotide-disulfide oxidoreductase [Steroidobacteraceae bacterium]
MQQARSRFSTEQLIFVAAALVLIIGSQLPVTHYMSPKSGLGYAIGIVGGTLILSQLLYAVRKRVRSLSFLGSVPKWFQTHMILGIVGPVCILLHCGFSLGATNSNIALFSMLTVSGSGIFGRYFYSKIHHGLYGRKATLTELQERAQDLRERATKILMMPELVNLLEDEERRLLAVADWGPARMLFAPAAIAYNYSSGRSRLRRYVRAAIRVTAARHKAVAKQSDRFERVAFDYVSRRMKVTREVVEFRIYEKLFSVWHVLHMPLFLMLIAAGIVHVISVHVY